VDFVQDCLRLPDIASSDKDRRTLLILRGTGEYATMHQSLDLRRLHPPMGEKDISTRIHRDHPVKDTGLLIRIQHQENCPFIHCHHPVFMHVPSKAKKAGTSRMSPPCMAFFPAIPGIQPGAKPKKMNYLGEKGCFAAAFLAVTSETAGSFFMARAIANLVAS